MDTNVMNLIQVGNTNVKDGYECQNLIQVGFVCLSHLDTNVKDGYECYIFDIGWDCLSDLDTNVNDGYECYIFDIGWV